MVGGRLCRPASLRAAAVAALFLCLPFAPAAAEVMAGVDRNEIELNESFNLEITVDSATNREPDASVLEDDFHVLDRSDLSNTMIINGQISRSRTWTYVLMAKRTGELQIPPVSVGGERSEPLTVRVAPQAAALPGESDVFVTADADSDETWVQAQVLYTVKVYRAVPTRQPRLAEPELEGVDVLVQPVGEETSYESLIGGKRYSVAERSYALFPQASGELSIAPAHFEARVLRDGRITGRKVFRSDPVTLEVKPIPPPPAGHPDAAWFPARSVQLGESWSREPDSLPAGEPITRHVTVTALGQLSTQIPALEVAEPETVKVYPDKPELRVSADPSGIVAARKDQYAMIGTDPGDVHLPALELPWWNLEKDAWEIASLPARTIRILPGADALPVPAVAAFPDAAPEGETGEVTSRVFWRNVSLGLTAAWAGTLLLWWASRRRPPRPAGNRTKDEPPLHRRQRRLLRNARRAAQNGDVEATRSALMEWARLQWPERPPRSIGELADRAGEPLAPELEKLGRVSYGPAGEGWDGSALARALRSASFSPQQRVRPDGGELPPLMPRA